MPASRTHSPRSSAPLPLFGSPRSEREHAPLGRHVRLSRRGFLAHEREQLGASAIPARGGAPESVELGIDAVRLSLPLAATSQYRSARPTRRAGTIEHRRLDIAPSLAKYLRDAVFGLDLTGDIGPIGVFRTAAGGLRTAAGGLGLRSEYGAMPFGLFAQAVVNLW